MKRKRRHGTYTVEDGVIHAQLTSDLEQSTQNWDFRITGETGAAELEMVYQDTTIYWDYGDREDVPVMGVSGDAGGRLIQKICKTDTYAYKKCLYAAGILL